MAKQTDAGLTARDPTSPHRQQGPRKNASLVPLLTFCFFPNKKGGAEAAAVIFKRADGGLL